MISCMHFARPLACQLLGTQCKVKVQAFSFKTHWQLSCMSMVSIEFVIHRKLPTTFVLEAFIKKSSFSSLPTTGSLRSTLMQWSLPECERCLPDVSLQICIGCLIAQPPALLLLLLLLLRSYVGTFTASPFACLLAGLMCKLLEDKARSSI